ncbi:MAG: hypothetical protein Q9175_007906, partial [Cornicularia normoerica]
GPSFIDKRVTEGQIVYQVHDPTSLPRTLLSKFASRDEVPHSEQFQQHDDSVAAASTPAATAEPTIDAQQPSAPRTASNMASSHAHPGFPTLQPCCIWRMNVGETTPTGTVESVPGFEPAFKANITFGADWLQFDPSGEYGRIEYRGIAKTEDGGHPIDFRYIGIITMTPDVKKIFNFQPDMRTVPFGFS